MKKTDKITKMDLLKEYNFYYSSSVAYDYDSSYDCESAGCDEICRCRHIDDFKITSIDYQNLCNVLIDTLYTKKALSQEQRYCLERAFKHIKLYDRHLYDPTIEWSYYGQEIERIDFDWSSAPSWFVNMINTFMDHSASYWIEYLLTVEYSKVLPKVKNKTWEIECIDKNDLIYGNPNHEEMIKKSNVSYYLNWKFPLGLALPVENGKFRLIDGYHRCCDNESDKMKLMIGR